MRKRNTLAIGLMTTIAAAAVFTGCSNGATTVQDASYNAQPLVQAPQARVSKLFLASNGVQTVNGDIEVVETTPAPTSADGALSVTEDALIAVRNEAEELADAGDTSAPTLDRPVVKRGTTNDAVTALQKELMELGYLKGYTGYFGTDTEQALEEFQKANNLVIDGIAGTRTWDALFSGSAVGTNTARSV